MKLIKFGIAAIVVILALNYFGLLSPNFSKKVDDVSEAAFKTSKEKWNELPIAKDVSNELLNSVSTLSSPVNYENKGDGVYVLSGTSLTGTLNNNSPKSLELSFDPAKVSTVHQAEGLLSLFVGKIVELPLDKMNGIATVKIKVTYTDNKFVVNSNIAGFDIT
ncbi:MAG: hypothetical protein AB6733_21055 [Clostridiaceae bacterium]